MLISSKMTYFYKRIFPVLWFGFLAFFVLMAVPASFAVSKTPNKTLVILPFLVVPAMMAGFGFFLFRSLIFDLADEVTDEGTALNVRKGDVVARIRLADIINVNSTMLVNPPRITLTLRQPCALGDRVSFLPPARFRFFPGFSIHPIAEDLIRRIDAAGRR
jgi:hypothetical protein